MTIYRQIRNDAKNIQAIADNYKTVIDHEQWLVNGLQKDAIQNSWDARIDKKHGAGWECGFKLLEIDGIKTLCIKDSGTTGLNGTKFQSELQLGEILNTNNQGEDLAYFLNSDWSAKSNEEGGNRGRGKTLFLYASQNRKIFFDSLRSADNEYLFGELYLDVDKQIKFKIFYNEEAKINFQKFSNNKLKLSTLPGTRIFIMNPHDSIIDSIKSGEIISYISYSRWEIIKKYQAKIYIDNGVEKKYISLSSWYEDRKNDDNNKEYPLEIIKPGTDYKIKRLVLRYAPNIDLPESIRGIAIQRGGMTIQRVGADELIREEGMADIYGWLEMEEKKTLEKEMKENCEGPEHFNFSWTQKPAKYLRDYLRIKVREFAKELKIVSSEQAKKNKVQRAAELEALKSLSHLFKNLDLFASRKGNKLRQKSNRKDNEPLRLSVPDIKFPNDNRRVNYGEIIENAYVLPINETDKELYVRITVYLLSKEEGRDIIIDEKEIYLNKNTEIKIGKKFLEISKDLKKGSYVFRAKMISLEDTDMVLPDGTKIEQATKIYERVNLKFYVETDPDEFGKYPFKFISDPSEDKQFLFRWEPDGDNGYIIFYNSNHPKYISFANDEEKLTRNLQDYLILIAYQIKIENLLADEKSDDKEIDFLIKSKDISGVLPFLLSKLGEYTWDLNK